MKDDGTFIYLEPGVIPTTPTFEDGKHGERDVFQNAPTHLIRKDKVSTMGIEGKYLCWIIDGQYKNIEFSSEESAMEAFAWCMGKLWFGDDAVVKGA